MQTIFDFLKCEPAGRVVAFDLPSHAFGVVRIPGVLDGNKIGHQPAAFRVGEQVNLFFQRLKAHDKNGITTNRRVT